MASATIGIIGISLFVIMDFDNTSQTYRNESMNPEISSFGENTYVVWSESINSEFFDVYFAKITNNTITKEPLNLTRGESFYPAPEILASGNNDVYVLWRDRTSPHGDETAFFKKSNDGGNTFGEPKKINTDLESNGVESQGIQIISYDDSVYIMWEEDYTDGYGNIHRKTWFAKSNDYGDTFDVVSVHPLDDLRSKYGHVYAYEEDNTLYFVVTSETTHFNEDVTIFFVNSHNTNSNNLETFDIVDVIGKSLPTFDVPKISINDNNIQIIGDVLRGENCILYVSSSDGGETFSESVNLSPNGTLKDCFAK